MSLVCDEALSVSGALEAQASGHTSALELTEAALARVEATSQLNAWVLVDADGARAQARAIDERRVAGDSLGPLAGVPVGIKDQICTQGMRTTAASKILENFVPPYDATVIARLRAADAVIIGKLNQDEFAMGSSNERSIFGPAFNPHDVTRVPGGSSGGSASAVAAGTCVASLGTDTGGSIRQPASFCGVVGLKPTYGRVSRWGAIAFASSLDQVGPIGRSVRDVAAVYSVIAGHDVYDSTSLNHPVERPVFSNEASLTGLRVGVPKEYFVDGITPAVKASVDAALGKIEALGATCVPVSLPHTEAAVATYYLLATAEASSNLSRYDGIRYGHRTPEPVSDIGALYAKSRAEGFGDEVKRRIILGTFVLSSGYYDAFYLKAQKVRTLIRRDFDAAFADVDVLATPTSPVTAFEVGAHMTDPLQMYLMDIFTIPSSLAGNTSLSLPCGIDADGLPIGLQLIAPPLAEARLLSIAERIERELAGWGDC